MPDLTPRPPAQRPLLWNEWFLDVLEALQDIEPEVPLYLVGGAVRDALLNRPTHDYDLTTPGNAIKMARKLADVLQGDVFILDAERGVARLLMDSPEGKVQLDFTQFRGADLLEDLQKRDFTLNAIAVDVRQSLTDVIDPLDGETHLLARMLILCSPTALSDDPLRVLRAIRQSAQFGFHIMPETLAQMRIYAPLLDEVSPERLRDELFALLSIHKVAAALRVAQVTGALAPLFPQSQSMRGLSQPPPNTLDVWDHTLYSMERLNIILTAISYARTDNTAALFDMGMLTMQLDRYRKQLNGYLDTPFANARTPRALMMLGMFIHLLAEPGGAIAALAEQTADRLRLSNPEKKRLMAMLAAYPELRDGHYSDLNVHRYWFTYGEAGIDGILCGMAHILGIYGAQLPQQVWLERVELAVRYLSAYFDRHAQLVSPVMLVNGNDLMETLHIAPGPVLGQLLTAIREAQVTGEVTTREAAFDLARLLI